MKKMSMAAMVVGLCLALGAGSASAESYSLNWFNNINHFTPMNAQPACTVTAQARLGATALDTKTISLADKQWAAVTVSAATCSSILLTAKCSFKNLKGESKTEIKGKLVTPCQGGDVVILPDPDDWKTYTTFGITFFCTPPCK